MLEYELEAQAQGYLQVCGVDEAGAGPLAGSVVAAAVILPQDCTILLEKGLTDSKKISEKKRDMFYDLICDMAVSYHIAAVSAQEIDNSDILSARLRAMCLAVEGIDPDFALVDGNHDKGQSCSLNFPHQLIVKGDSKSLSIAAASVLAKVHRDREMITLDKEYPEYGFAKHKGYGTKYHYEQVRTYKLCPIHRRTFFRKKWEELGLG